MELQPRICWVPSGDYPRIWLDLKVRDRSRMVRQLQCRLEMACTGGQSVPYHALHMTALHLGKPQELLRELRAVNDRLTFPEFRSLLEAMLDDWYQDELVWPDRLPVRSLERFGSERRPVVVLELGESGELAATRLYLWQRLERFLKDCGIDDPDRFTRESGILRTSRPDAYRPHVTVFWPPAGPELPDLAVPALVHFEGLKYHGVNLLPREAAA